MANIKEVSGLVEAWGTINNRFPGGRGSQGLLLRQPGAEPGWLNMIASMEQLFKAKQDFPPGSSVKFSIILNKKGFWDIKEGTITGLQEQLPEKPIEEVSLSPMDIAEKFSTIETILGELNNRISILEAAKNGT